MTAIATEPEAKRSCVVCGNLIAVSAAACPICNQSQAAVQCETCRKLMPANAKICPACKALPGSTDVCKNCGRPIPPQASYCNECRTYQKWRHLPLWAALLGFITLMISVGTTAYKVYSDVNDRNSHTDFQVVAADRNVIHLTVWNTGQKASILLGGQLRFPKELDIADLPLDIPNIDLSAQENVIATGHKPGALTIPGDLTLFRKSTGRAYTKGEIADLVKDDRDVTVVLRIAESSGSQLEVRHHTKFGRISPFVFGRMKP